MAHLRSVRRADPGSLERLTSGAERLDETLRVAAAVAARLESPLAERATLLQGELRGLASREAELRRAAAERDARALAAERRANGRTAAVGGDAALLRVEAEDLSSRAAEAATAAEESAERASAAARALTEADPGRARRPSELVLERLLSGTERLEAALDVDAERFEAPVRERAERQAARTGELGAALRQLGAQEVELRQAASTVGERLAAIDVELARTDAERDEARRRLEAADAEPAEGDRPRRARREARALRAPARPARAGQPAREGGVRGGEGAARGAVRAAAGSRVEPRRAREAPRRPDEDRRDAASRRRSRLSRRTSRRWRRRSSPAARAACASPRPRTRTSEPGIEVELRPAGKRVTRLSLLSGGEKALGAIAFLFSLFLARPSPFYLLDEVEAALDDTNIGRFTSLLRTYADRAQFIVITHQKRTMEAADVLYGVTMGGDGISQIVSRRLPRDEEAARTA